MDELRDEKPKYLTLVKNPSTMAKMAKRLFLTVLKLHGYHDPEPDIKLDENGENFHSLRVQSYSYEENGEKVYRNIDCRDKLLDYLEGIQTLTELMQYCVKQFGDQKYLGHRPVLDTKPPDTNSKQKSFEKYNFGDYEWITYSKTQEIINSLSFMFLQKGINRDKKMALFTKTCPMWLMCAFALFQISSPVVTIYSTLSDENLVFALILSEAHAILVDSKSFERLIPLIKQIPSLKNVFCWVENQDNSKPNLPEDLQLEVVYVNIKMFTETPPPEDVQKIEPLHPGPNDLALIMYTSGTTGPPKGVMITHDNIISTIGITWPEREFWKGKVYLAYLPQAHILELIAESVMSLHGGSLGFGHPFTLFDNSPMIIPGTHGDAVALRPTFFATVPLLCDRIKKAALEKIEKSSEIKKIIFETAYNIKLNYLRAGLETPYLDKKIFKVFKDVLGGSASHAFIGGASLNRETEDFFSACFGRFKLAFGLTETCCAGALSNFDYWRTGNCGPITKCVELKLIPWEEGNYNPSDKNPRGEICISGKPVSSGYYKNQEETDKAFIKDENTGKIWFRTGDIGEILPDGTLRIVDRRKDIIKLKHGEYLSLVRVEQIIIQLKLVDMVCVMPNADCDYLVALIVPNREFCKEFFSKLDKKYHKMDIEDLLKDENATSKLRDEIAKNLQEMKCLDKYETPKKFFILSDLWTAESGILTPSAKLRRPIIAEKYRHLIKPNQDTPI